jgi:hypothetical protein
MASRAVKVSVCPDGFSLNSKGQCVEMKPVITPGAIMQGPECWPPVLPMTRALRQILTKIANREIKNLKGVALMREMDALQKLRDQLKRKAAQARKRKSTSARKK